MRDKIDVRSDTKPSLATSRRNFLASVALIGSSLGATLAAGTLGARRVQANDGGGHEECDDGRCRCFLAGTRIQTPDGEVAVERLQIGDLVKSVTGANKRIKWIGRTELRREPDGTWRNDVLPVKIARFALNAGTPHHDLYVSPGHALYLNGVLIPAMNLVNGLSITQHRSIDSFTLQYYHIELSSHDVIFAEGAPAETYLAQDNRQVFDNAEEYARLYGPEHEPMVPFAPIVSLYGGRQELWSRMRSIVAPIYDRRRPLEIIRDEVADRAEMKLAA